MRAKLTKLGCAQAMPIREEDRRGIPRRVATPLACSLDQPLNLCLICLLRLVACSASAAFLTEGRHGHPVPPKIVEPERAITPSRNMWKLIEPAFWIGSGVFSDNGFEYGSGFVRSFGVGVCYRPAKT